MPLPTGLLPAFAFVLTVGLSGLTAVGALLAARAGADPFTRALAAAFGSVGGLYAVGVAVVWWLAGGGGWAVAAALVAAGVVAVVILGVVPLSVGQRLVRRDSGVDAGPALRLATVGWPVAMLVVFGLFVAPGGPGGGHLLDLGGPRTCLVGFCGVSTRLLVAVVVSGLVAVFGPGLVGIAVHRATTRPGGPN